MESKKDQAKENETHQDENTTTPQSKPIDLTDEQAVKAYVNDPEIRANHLKMAEQLKSIFDNKWFTVDMIANKTLMKDKKVAAQMMFGLQLFNMVTAAEGGVNYKHQTKFKLTLSIEDRLKVLEQHKNNHLKQIELIDKEIADLTSQQNTSSSSEK